MNHFIRVPSPAKQGKSTKRSEAVGRQSDGLKENKKPVLYNTSREAFLQQGYVYTALVIDGLYKAGGLAGQQFTVAQAEAALAPLQTPKRVIHIGLRHAVFQRRGRRFQVFTLPEANEVRKALGAKALHIRDNLPDTAFKSAKAYRMAYHDALIRRKAGTYTRGLLARRLGVCKQTTRNYGRALGHIVTEQFNRMPLLPSDLEALPGKRPMRGSKRRKWLARIDPGGFIDGYAPPVKAVALKWLQSGFAVAWIEQIGSFHRPAPDMAALYGSDAAFMQS